MTRLYSFHGGVHPPENKHIASEAAIQTLPLPPVLHLPLNQSIGNAAKPCVSVGDVVQKGQRIAEADGHVSVAVHAPTSGTITAIAPRPFAHPSGLPEMTISLQPDGQDQWCVRQGLDWANTDNRTLRDFLRDMGVVGLGGAVFPTSLKVGSQQLDSLIINGAECEPYITCDDRLMRERADQLVAGIRVLVHCLQPKEVLIGVEDNKPEAIAALQHACQGTAFSVVVIPTRYPSGGAKQLIRLLTGKSVPHGMRSTDMGVQCFNIATVYSIWRAVEHGEPVISRIVTLTGAVQSGRNIEALIGTPVDWLLSHAHPAADMHGVLMGGPMMGFDLPDLSVGIVKATNCLIAKNKTLFPPRPPALPCIRCGECAQACPAELQPMDLYWFAKSRDFGRAQEWDLFDCIECGACSYVCPSQIPLVDYYRFAKSEIWDAERDKKAADVARTRHEFRQFRLERDKAEKAARLAAKNAQPLVTTATAAPAAGADDAKRAAIEAAMKRAAERKASGAETAEKPPVDADKKAAIEAAMKRAAERKAAKAAEGESAPPPTAPVEKPAIDPDKKAAIEAAMKRAAERKAAKAAEGESAPPPPAPVEKPAIDPDKKAAIEAAMKRAAERKAAKAAESSSSSND